MSIVADDAIRRFLGLPYRIVLSRTDDEESPWRASVEELEGCEAQGSTPADAAARVPAAMADWVATAQAEGRDVPAPAATRAYSGKLLLRMPQSLHGELSRAAEQDQVSLNAYITGLLAAAVSWRRPGGGPVPAADRAATSAASGEAQYGEEEVARAARLTRFLGAALIANVVVVAIAAAIAVALLLSA